MLFLVFLSSCAQRVAAQTCSPTDRCGTCSDGTACLPATCTGCGSTRCIVDPCTGSCTALQQASACTSVPINETSFGMTGFWQKYVPLSTLVEGLIVDAYVYVPTLTTGGGLESTLEIRTGPIGSGETSMLRMWFLSKTTSQDATYGADMQLSLLSSGYSSIASANSFPITRGWHRIVMEQMPFDSVSDQSNSRIYFDGTAVPIAYKFSIVRPNDGVAKRARIYLGANDVIFGDLILRGGKFASQSAGQLASTVGGPFVDPSDPSVFAYFPFNEGSGTSFMGAGPYYYQPMLTMTSVEWKAFPAGTHPRRSLIPIYPSCTKSRYALRPREGMDRCGVCGGDNSTCPKECTDERSDATLAVAPLSGTARSTSFTATLSGIYLSTSFAYGYDCGLGTVVASPPSASTSASFLLPPGACRVFATLSGPCGSRTLWSGNNIAVSGSAPGSLAAAVSSATSVASIADYASTLSSSSNASTAAAAAAKVAQLATAESDLGLAFASIPSLAIKVGSANDASLSASFLSTLRTLQRSVLSIAPTAPTLLTAGRASVQAAISLAATLSSSPSAAAASDLRNAVLSAAGFLSAGADRTSGAVAGETIVGSSLSIATAPVSASAGTVATLSNTTFGLVKASIPASAVPATADTVAIAAYPNPYPGLAPVSPVVSLILSNAGGSTLDPQSGVEVCIPVPVYVTSATARCSYYSTATSAWSSAGCALRNVSSGCAWCFCQ